MSSMTWGELYEVMQRRWLTDENFMSSNVTVYNAVDGDLCLADTIMFNESDETGLGQLILSINIEEDM